MIKGIEAILISSENAQNLADFYKNKVGLELISENEIGDNGEKAFELKVGEGCGLYVMDHSEVKGKNTQAPRIMFNLEVSHIEDEVEKLKKTGVKLIQDIYHVEEYGQIATFEDIDGNYFQLVQVRPN